MIILLLHVSVDMQNKVNKNIAPCLEA